jgi:hypothetical protein
VRADRKMVRYRSQREPDTALRGRLRELANARVGASVGGGWDGLSPIPQYNRIEKDKNLVENAIRPLALTRKKRALHQS